MTKSPQFPQPPLPLKRAAFILAGVWTTVIVLGAGWHLFGEYENTVETARIQASGSFEKDLVYRRWAAGYGGVYIPVSEEMPPNPYLWHIENRDVTTTSGLDLTLVNPAYMTRQVHELGREQYGHQGHITSLNPIRPENAPDAWETKALTAFERGETEVADLAMIGDKEYLRLMRPLITEARCLKCHAAQGYEEGDPRGGISVSVPMAPLWTIMYGGMASVSVGYGVVWLLGLVGICFGALRLRRRIHERDRAEAALRTSEARFRSLVETTSDWVWEVDAEGVYTYSGPKVRELLGYEPEEVVGKTPFDFMPPNEAKRAADQFIDIAAAREPFAGVENINLHRDGRRILLETSGVPVIDADGTLLGYRGIDRDITERKQAERALRSSEQRYRELFSNMTSGVAVYAAEDDGNRFVFKDINDAGRRLSKLGDEDIVGRDLAEAFPGVEEFGLLDTLKEVWRTGETRCHPVRQYKDARLSFWYENTVYKLPSGDVVAVYDDVTDRKRADDVLHQYEHIVSSTTDMLALVDRHYVYLAANEAYLRTFAKASDEVIGQTVAEVFGQDFFSTVIRPLAERCLAGEDIRYQEWFDFPGAGRKYMDVAYSPYLGAAAQIEGFVVTARDITKRKRTEDELKQRTRDLGERLKELNCLYFISKLTGQPDVTVEEILQGAVDVIPSSWQYPGVTKARITMEGRVYSTADFRESQWRQAAEIVVQGEPIGRVEAYYLTEQPAGDEGPFLREERSLINAIAERLGRTVQHIRLEEERVVLREQLYQAQKMEAVAQLAGGVAHDFNNLLTVISGYVSLAKDVLPDNHKALESLNGVQEAADQAAGVTRSLLTFSHKTETRKEAVELHASVEKSLRLLRHVLPAGINVVADTAGEPVWVRADGTQLQQIIMNLAINARDAMPDGGTLRISVSQSARHPKALSTLGKPDGLIARLVVSDSGIGMDPAVRERIFEPFFTTKPRGQGTGLGLAIIHSIVDEHAGHVRVQSEPGEGTTFTVEFPLLEVDAGQDVPEEATPPRRGRGEVVLLAEDNRHVRGILTSALESLGYEVIRANDGLALMGCFERHRKRITLLVIDADLPKRSGPDCLREIRSSGGFAPTIVITASADAGLEKRLDEDTTLLRKPFQIADFSALAGNVLAARGQRKEHT